MPENSVKRYLTYNLLKLKSFFLSKDVLSFLVFLFLSAAFWFLNALNQERELTLTLPIVYKGVPKDIHFEDQLPDEVQINLTDQGIHLWSYVINRPRNVELVVDQVFQERGIVSIPGSTIQAAVGRLVLPSTLIQIIKPENIAVHYHRLHSKKVPVRLQADIVPAEQYMLNNAIQLLPDSVVIYGSKSLVSKTKHALTKQLLVEGLKDTLFSEVGLIKNDSLQYSSSYIKVRSSAEMFTEKSVNLPVQIINQPDHLSVRSFPAEVKVTFNITISQFKHFTSTDIQVLIDYLEIKNHSADKHRLQLAVHQPYISNVRISPEEVEFLLEEK
ncbi:MAG: hypothetical protein PHU68_08880 [Paludibacter sp.]|nr:hypothetical protein [Paludibacter sp.]